MKKSLKIAALGVAAFGFAAAPAFVFADEAAVPGDAVGSHIDALRITVDMTCTLGTLTNGAYDDKTAAATDATTHTNGIYDDPKTNTTTETLGTWSNGTSTPAGVRTDTLALTMQPGTSSENIGSTTFTVRCNNAAGYALKAQGTGALKIGSSTAEEDAIPAAAAVSGNSYWNFVLSDASTDGMTVETGFTSAVAVPTVATTIAKKTSAGNIDGGETVKVTYGAGISKSQKTGLYEGSVTYTLYSL